MRKNNYSYEIIRTGILSPMDAIIGKNIYYKCAICQKEIPSQPKDNISCDCGNIGIDKDMHKLYVEDNSKIIILRKVSS